MATITPVVASSAGAALSYVAATGGGDSLVCGSAAHTTSFHVRNGGSTITVTLAGVVQCSQGFTHNKAVTALAGDTEIVIPAQCIDPATGLCAVTYSGVVTVTVAATTTS